MLELRLSKKDKIIHLYGPPAVGKTTFALQIAKDFYPKSVFYFCTSHEKAIKKRAQQVLKKEMLEQFFLIKSASLKDLFSKLEQILDDEHSTNVGLVVIDFITDFVRGMLYKEEVKEQVRKILEKLFVFTDRTSAKAVIINSFSINSEAPLYSLVESFSDLSFKLLFKESFFSTEEKEKGQLRILEINETLFSYFAIVEEGIKDFSLLAE